MRFIICVVMTPQSHGGKLMRNTLIGSHTIKSVRSLGKYIILSWVMVHGGKLPCLINPQHHCESLAIEFRSPSLTLSIDLNANPSQAKSRRAKHPL